MLMNKSIKSHLLKYLLLGSALLISPLTVQAQGVNSIMIADNSKIEMKQSVTLLNSTGEQKQSVLLEPQFTANKLHKYLGIGSIGLAVLTVISPKEEDGPHEYFAQGAALLGGAAVASGLTIHLDDINLDAGWRDPDNQHALLAALGTLGFILAVSQAPSESHAGAGAFGFAAMALGIKLTW
jgi:hypothetical protein